MHRLRLSPFVLSSLVKMAGRKALLFKMDIFCRHYDLGRARQQVLLQPSQNLISFCIFWRYEKISEQNLQITMVENTVTL